MNKYAAIDLDIILSQVASLAYIADAKEAICNEEIICNPLLIRQKLQYTKEALNIIEKDINVSFDGIENINSLLTKAEKGITLSANEIVKVLVFNNHVERMMKIFNNLEEEYTLEDFSDSLRIDHKLAQNITEALDNNGNIKETASKHLSEICYAINANEKALHDAAYTFLNRHAASLQESGLFYRNERLTFLVKNSDKNKFHGTSYGMSASGQASYVEPGSFIEMNNKRLSLQVEKEEEINRILRQLSQQIAQVSTIYRADFDSLLKLQIIFAKAHYGFKNNGVIAQLSDDKQLLLKDIIHPLIPVEKAVSNTYRLYKPYQGVVISGTNTGGKTVGLKIIGLSVLMAYLGIPLPASEARIPFYNHIFIDIDDNQSVVSSLSTFSAHITNIDTILTNANQDSLILIDELISGTDPKEAQAISLAILERIIALGAHFVITTHYDDLKNFAYDHPLILLSAVGFDLKTLKPTYRYSENTVGASNALDIAERYLSDKNLIKRARQIVSENSSKQDELLKKLALDIQENEKLHKRLKEQLAINEQKNAELAKQLADFAQEKETLKAKYLAELEQDVEAIRLEALEKLEEALVKKDTKTVAKIEELKPVIKEPKPKDEHFALGDNVRVSGSEQIGTITAINGQQVCVDVRGLSIKTKLANLTKMPKTPPKASRKMPPKTIRKVNKELNLVGQRVDEGLVNMESFLDTAFGSGTASVKLIHGIGTGQLRAALRNRLKQLSFVKSFHDGDYYDGGSAVTIVEFKK